MNYLCFTGRTLIRLASARVTHASEKPILFVTLVLPEKQLIMILLERLVMLHAVFGIVLIRI